MQAYRIPKIGSPSSVFVDGVKSKSIEFPFQVQHVIVGRRKKGRGGRGNWLNV